MSFNFMATVTTVVILEPKRKSVTASTFSPSICHEMMEPVFIPIPKKGNTKECSNYCTVALISHPSKVTLKILQARLQRYMNHELPDIQAGFRKGRGARDQIANICWIMEKARVPEIHLSSIQLLIMSDSL